MIPLFSFLRVTSTCYMGTNLHHMTASYTPARHVTLFLWQLICCSNSRHCNTFTILRYSQYVIAYCEVHFGTEKPGLTVFKRHDKNARRTEITYECKNCSLCFKTHSSSISFKEPHTTEPVLSLGTRNKPQGISEQPRRICFFIPEPKGTTTALKQGTVLSRDTQTGELQTALGTGLLYPGLPVHRTAEHTEDLYVDWWIILKRTLHK